MLGLVNQFSVFSNLSNGLRYENGTRRKVVLLTGATGTLGTHILHLLRSDDTLAQVICLVRGKSVRQRVSNALTSRQKEPLRSEARDIYRSVVCVKASLGEKNLGLSSQDTLYLSQNVSTIIHAAWDVNFSIPLRSFVNEHIAGLSNLLSLFKSCTNQDRFVFCSSTASVLGHGHPEIIPEQISKEPSDSDGLGYSRSKWVAEAICNRANQEESMRGRVRVARIGQLTGDTKHGIWNMKEAWPLMMSTVDTIGCLPSLNGHPTWLPVDTAAKTIFEIALKPHLQERKDFPILRNPVQWICCKWKLTNFIARSQREECLVYHVVSNSTSTTWADMFDWLQSARGKEFQVVEFSVWLQKLGELEDHPAKSLIGLWQGLELKKTETKHTIFSTDQTEKISDAMKNAKAIDEDLVRKIWSWLKGEIRSDKIRPREQTKKIPGMPR